MAGKEKRIKILYTIPNFDTAGSGKALLNIATRLDPKKFEPHIMCMHDRGEFFKVVKQSGIQVHLHEYTTTMKPYWKGLMNCWKTLRVFKNIAPDIIHSFHYSSDYSEALAARLAGIKWVYTKKNMSWGGSSRNSWILRTRFASGIITINKEMLSAFFKGKQNVVNISRGVDTTFFEPSYSPDDYDESLSSGRNIICVANLVPIKGVELLIDAFGKIVDLFPEWGLILVGDDTSEYAQELKNHVLRLGLQNKIIFMGKQIDVKSFLDKSEILVLPTLQKGEGFGVVIIEAMANGKVVLASNVPGIRDQLKEFPESLFEAGDSGHLETRLRELMQKSKFTLKQEGMKFREYCKINFDIKYETNLHERVYERLMSGGKELVDIND